MSDTSSFGFGKFIPGFEFLQGLAKGATTAHGAAAGSLPEWVAPTVSIEEVDKRIAELKAVQFWLEQNGKALSATIQALQVQRMTLSTLKGMDVSLAELAQSFAFPKPTQAQPAPASGFSGWPMPPAPEAAAAPEPAAAPAQPAGSAAPAAAPADQEQAAAGVQQAMQWWGALTQQFQQIASQALAEPLSTEAMAAAAKQASGMVNGLAQAAMDINQAATRARKPAQDTPAEPARKRASAKPKPAAGKAASRTAAKAKPPAKAADPSVAKPRAGAPRKAAAPAKTAGRATTAANRRSASPKTGR